MESEDDAGGIPRGQHRERQVSAVLRRSQDTAATATPAGASASDGSPLPCLQPWERSLNRQTDR